MQAFMHRQNIERFKQLLRSETDQKQRAVLVGLLETEKSQLAALEGTGEGVAPPDENSTPEPSVTPTAPGSGCGQDANG